MEKIENPKYLMILEVSQKQNYIFGVKSLRDKVIRSPKVQEATENNFLEKLVNDGTLYSNENNLVYTGGGHTVLQFNDKEKAKDFSKAITRAAIENLGGIEVFVKIIDYDDNKCPSDNLNALISALEKKKSLHKNAFRRNSIGIEELTTENFKIKENSREPNKVFNGLKQEPIKPAEEGYKYADEFEEIAGKDEETADNFIAVVHIDGNSTGAQVAEVQKKYSDWEECKKGMQNFSKGIQEVFENAFRETEKEIIKSLKIEPGTFLEPVTLPLRPVILDRDDVCFVTKGKYGLEITRIFLKKLSEKVLKEDKRYSACAGVALVHTKYPFNMAYDLSEELCLNAKKFSVALDPGGGICAMDWHIEFGQLKGSLSEIREEYKTEDGKSRLELRPVAVIDLYKKAPTYRTYEFVKKLAAKISENKNLRSKMKGLRNAMKQGEVETDFYLQQKEISKLIKVLPGVDSKAFEDIDVKGKTEKRCLFFDAVEIVDHFEII